MSEEYIRELKCVIEDLKNDNRHLANALVKKRIDEAKEKLAKFGALVLSKGIFNMATNEFLKLDDPGIKEAVEELINAN